MARSTVTSKHVTHAWIKLINIQGGGRGRRKMRKDNEEE